MGIRSKYYYQRLCYIILTMEDLQKTVNIQSFTYQNNLLAASRDSKIYLATTPHNKNLRPLIFKGYSQIVLNDPIKQKKFIQQIKFLWKLNEKENILQILSQHYRDRMVFIITQYCEGGNLANHIKNFGPFTEEKAVGYLRQIINGYQQIHRASIIHRNLEPSNILISGLEIKIADFSDAIERKDALLTSKKEEIVGTLIYQAPQVLEKYKYSQMSDIYSIGLIFYAMLKGSSPFDGQNKTEILEQMKVFKLQNVLDLKLGKRSRQFLQKCLVYDEQNRMSVQEMLNYIFYEVPQLSLTKFYTFDEEKTPQKQMSRKAVPSFQQNQQPSSKMIKLLSIINDTVPQKSKSKTSSTSIHLKMSEELDISKLSNQKDISIFIPSKLNLVKKESNQAKMARLPADQITSLDFQPSIMVLPSQKDHSASSKKSFRHLTKNIITGEKPYNMTDSVEFKANLTRRQQFTGRTLDTERVKTKLQVNPFSITSSRNRQPIEVVVHSPKKPQKLKNYSQSTIKQDTGDQYLILSYLLSQVFMSRFLSRVVFYVERVNELDTSQLCQELQCFRLYILAQIKQLTLVDEELAQNFKNSAEYAQLLEIVKIYEQKSRKKSNFKSLRKTKEILLKNIQLLFQLVKESQRFSGSSTKALDYMVKCWQLIKLLQKGSLQTFHLQSGVEQLIDSKNESARISTLLDVYSRMLSLKIIAK